MLIWLYSHMSFYFIHLLFLFGLIAAGAGFLLGSIPFVSLYSAQIKTLGILIIFLSLYLEGGLTANNEWVVKMKQVQQDINNIETKSGKIVVKVSTDYAEQVQNIHDALERIQIEIKKESTKVNADCHLSTDAIDILNDAAKHPVKVKK